MSKKTRAHDNPPGELERIFNRCNSDGSFHYSNDDVKNVLPVILLRNVSPDGLARLDEPVLRMTAEFVAKLGVNLERPDPADFEDCLRKHWAKHPPNAELIRDLRERPSEHQAGVDRIAKNLRLFADSADRRPETPSPEGSLRNAADIRFTLSDWQGREKK